MTCKDLLEKVRMAVLKLICMLVQKTVDVKAKHVFLYSRGWLDRVQGKGISISSTSCWLVQPLMSYVRTH